jgi:hypothetical protein
VNRSVINAAAGAAASAVIVSVLAGCATAAIPPPPRPKAVAGPEWQTEVSYFREHPVKVPSGMLAGILVSESSPGYACLDGWCRTWQGTVVTAGGYVEQLSSDQGDDGMAQLAQPGDVIEFPAANVPVDAPSDSGEDTPASVLVSGAVRVG